MTDEADVVMTDEEVHEVDDTVVVVGVVDDTDVVGVKAVVEVVVVTDGAFVEHVYCPESPTVNVRFPTLEDTTAGSRSSTNDAPTNRGGSRHSTSHPVIFAVAFGPNIASIKEVVDVLSVKDTEDQQAMSQVVMLQEVRLRMEVRLTFAFA
ncbi:hypothetical protein HK101_002950, partial [Irineochytrium annulatum]